MSNAISDRKQPPCYALLVPGLEPIAQEEIADELGGEVKRTGEGIVVFRVAEVDRSLLQLRTVEDVFLYGWGTDQLTYRAEDLDRIRRWTAREADWSQLLRLHHALRPKPKGKPTFRLVTQMSGTHGYRRIDAGRALAEGLRGKLPASWKHADENADVEIWLTIQGKTAVCGVRLSDRTMRHRTYKREHLPASLRPTVAAAMVRLADVKPNHVIMDPMCGAGTILCELHQMNRYPRGGGIRVCGGDIELAALRAAAENLRRIGQTPLCRWNATRLPLPDRCVDRLLSNPPFGKQLGDPEEIEPLYRNLALEFERILKPGGRAVLLVKDFRILDEAARAVGWKLKRQLHIRVLGQTAALMVWNKSFLR